MSQDKAPKLVGIEFLRFICAFSVLVWHFQHFAFQKTGIEIQRAEQPFYWLLKPFYNFGAFGVNIFWCISGFIFFFKYFDALSRREVPFREFFINRFSRLYPLHILTLFVVAGLQPVFYAIHDYFFVYPYNDIRHFILNVFFVSYWGMESGHSFNAPIWSVSLELIVYLLFFVSVSRMKVSWTYITAFLLAFITWKIGRLELSECIAYFFAGGVVALFRFFPDRIPLRLPPNKDPFHLLGGATVAAMALLMLRGAKAFHGFPGAMLKLGIGVLAVYIFVAANRFFLPVSRTAALLGNLTYSSYLIHFPVQLAFVIALPAAGIAIDYRSPALLFGFLTTTFVISVFVFRYFEAPMQKIIRKRYSKRTVVADPKPALG